MVKRNVHTDKHGNKFRCLHCDLERVLAQHEWVGDLEADKEQQTAFQLANVAQLLIEVAVAWFDRHKIQLNPNRINAMCIENIKVQTELHKRIPGSKPLTNPKVLE